MIVRAILIPAFLFFAALFLYPLSRLLGEGFAGTVEFPWWRDAFLWRVIAFTYGQAFLSAVVSAAVGIPGAFLYAEDRFPGRELFWRLSLVTFSLPTLLVALAFAALGGQRVFGWPALLAVHAFFNFPLYTRQVGAALLALDRSQEKAALSLGASRWTCFRHTTLPRLLPEIGSAFLLSFLFCSMTFLVPLLLGGGPRFTTIEVAVYQAVKVDFDPPLAARLAALQLAVGLLVHLLARRRRVTAGTPAAEGTTVPLYYFRSRRRRIAARLVYFAVLTGLVVAPLYALAESGFGALENVDQWVGPLLTSLELAGLVVVIALPLALAFAYAGRHGYREIELVAGLPLSVSSLILMLALSRAFPIVRDIFDGVLLPIAVVQALIALPLVFRPLHDGFARLGEPMLREAASLGASPWQRLWLVELPALRRPLVLAGIFAATFSLGEVAAPLLFAGDAVETLPIAIYRAMARYRFAEGYAGGVVLLAATALGHWIASRGER